MEIGMVTRSRAGQDFIGKFIGQVIVPVGGMLCNYSPEERRLPLQG
jgi:hypothetical protein